MARYLWVGKDTTGISFNLGNIDGAEHIDQYCWNIPGNWRKFSTQTLRFDDSWEIPKPNDEVVVGNPRLFGYDMSSFLGWTRAKSPLLWGGYTGTVGSGSWSVTGSLTDATHAGTTTNSSLANFYFDQGKEGTPGEHAYPFPYLGGGLTGEVLNWVAARDGLPTYVYSGVYSNTGRLPEIGLTLKVTGYVWFNTWKHYAAEHLGLTAPQQINASNRLIMDVNFVKSLSIGSATGPTGGLVVGTKLRFNEYGNDNALYYTNLLTYPCTAGLRITNGSFESLSINPYEAPAMYSTQQSYSLVGDYRVELTNVIANSVTCGKRQFTKFTGCTFAYMNLTQYGWGGQAPSGGTGYIAAIYSEQVPVTISSNFNAPYVFADLYGITNTALIPSSYQGGRLDLNSIPVLIRSSMTGGFAYQPPSVVYNNPTGTDQNNRQAVIIGDANGSSTTTIPYISIASSWNNSTALHYMPWGLEMAGDVSITRIDNYGGDIYSNESISTTKTVSITQTNLGGYGTINFSKKSDLFDDWRFGGLSGSTISGGILFVDETGKVHGSEGVRLWNTQVRGKAYDARSNTILGLDTLIGNSIA